MSKFFFFCLLIFLSAVNLGRAENHTNYENGFILLGDLEQEIYFFPSKAKKDEVLLHFKKIGGGPLEGKSFKYLFEDMGNGKAEVYFMQKKGPKKSRFVVLSKQDIYWNFHDPNEYQRQFALHPYVPKKENKVYNIDLKSVFKKISKP